MIKKIYRVFNRIRKKFARKWYTWIIKKQVKQAGDGLTVNRKSHATDTTILGKNVNFNGMVIEGGGNVSIGDNFHSGSECLIITQNHNYDRGNAIPYDDSYVLKNVRIGENVWFGDRVVVLGGGKNRRGGNYTGRECCNKEYPVLCCRRWTSCSCF